MRVEDPHHNEDRCPGPLTVSKSRNLKMKIRPGDSKDVSISDFPCSKPHPIITSLIGVAFVLDEFPMDMGYRIILPTHRSDLASSSSFHFNSKWVHTYYVCYDKT